MTPPGFRLPAARTLDVSLGEGWTARVGRTDGDNDLLTFHESFPRDLWLHVKGCPGSHVVLHHPEEHDPPKEILREAARLAARHSKAKSAKTATVTVARIADLQKPRRAPAGQVIVRKEKSLRVVF